MNPHPRSPAVTETSKTTLKKSEERPTWMPRSEEVAVPSSVRTVLVAVVVLALAGCGDGADSATPDEAVDPDRV